MEDRMNKLPVVEHQEGIGSPIFVVECPSSQKRISISHCNRKLCPHYKGRKEMVDEDIFFIACNYKLEEWGINKA